MNISGGRLLLEYKLSDLKEFNLYSFLVIGSVYPRGSQEEVFISSKENIKKSKLECLYIFPHIISQAAGFNWISTEKTERAIYS